MSDRLLWRVALLLGMVIAVGMTLALSGPSVVAAADPALARLLRGMALLKAVMTLAAAAAVFWRLGRRASPSVTAAYVGSIWLMTVADVLIWQLTSIIAAAVAFHLALLGVLIVAWRDDRAPFAHRFGLFGSPKRIRPAALHLSAASSPSQGPKRSGVSNAPR